MYHRPATIMKKHLALILAVLTLQAFAAEPVHLDRKGERWASTTLRHMTLEEKIGQMIMVWAHVEFMNTTGPDYTHLVDEIHQYHLGGFGVTVGTDGPLLLKGDPIEAAFITNSLQKQSRLPLIMAADFERGASMRLIGPTDFPAAMAFGAAGDPALARQFGRVSALEARAIGIQWNWFPIADVNSNPANPIINTRSFGEDPAQVSALLSAYIEGARAAGLLTTAKHFPGHGDTDTDSHLALARVTGDTARLNSLELVPFRAAISAGVDSVMIGHLIVPAVEPDPNRPASVSSNIINGLLRKDLGFHGLVVTDGLGMNGLLKTFSGTPAQVSAEEAVAAVQAGNDVLCLPPDLDVAYHGLLDAVHNGTISRQRIDESVLRILRMKASVGLNTNRFVSLDDAAKAVAAPESVTLAQTVADRAITLAKDDAHLFPLEASQSDAKDKLTAVVFTDSPRGSDGSRAFIAELRQRAPGATILSVDNLNARFVSENVLRAVQHADRVLVLAEAVPSAGRIRAGNATGSAGLDTGPAQLLASIAQSAGSKTIYAAFGNPYTGIHVPGIQTYLCTFSNVPTSARALVRALFGEIPIHGRLPVTLPGIAARGTGLDR
jgi:beta-N-acetylhexosaminidase